MDEHEFSPPPISPNVRSRKPERLAPGWGTLAIPLAILLAVLFFPIWFWVFCRIEPGPGEIAVLIRKTGKDLPSGQILALEPGQKGIQLEVLAEGRWFKNPYVWDWEIRKITDIPAGKLGVLTRLYGNDLPGGQILAPEGYKGIVAKVLGPGALRTKPKEWLPGKFVHPHDAAFDKDGNIFVVEWVSTGRVSFLKKVG